ncbi:sigma-70 family RNA polymerase sigma factor [Bacillus velezensis]
MEDLLFEYKRTLKETKKWYKQLEAADETVLTSEELKDKKSSERLLQIWNMSSNGLKKAKQPGIRRAIDRRDAYQRMLIKDPRIIETYSQALMFEPSANMTEEDRIRLRDALAVLTDREKEMLLLHKAECFSYERIAALLNVKKSTVQTTVKRALLKIQKQQEQRNQSPAS